MVAFNTNNGQSEEDRAMEKIYEEMDELGRDRVEQIVGSILVLVEAQLKSQIVQGFDEDKIAFKNDEELEDLIWGVHSEFFGD